MGISFTDKTSRTLRMLLGLRYAEVAGALREHGFTASDEREGWDLLKALGTVRGQMLRPEVDVKIIEKLDAWENYWFPIVQAALTRRFPAVAAKFFQNLSQVDGPEVAITVQLFVERYDELTKEGSPYGAEGPKAVELLTQRGLTADVLAEPRALLEELRTIAAPLPATSMEEVREGFSKAEDALWAWYLEWSQVARTAVKNRWLLHQMGFLNSSGSSAQDDTAPEDVAAAPTNGATTPTNAPTTAAATPTTTAVAH